MKKISDKDKLKELSFITLYGSQLGQAESIADGIVDKASNYGLKTEAYVLNEIKDITDLANLNIPIVIISSTTGDGEPPENADKFWRKIRRRTNKPDTLQSVKYTILGLGDTNFNNFCNCGKQLNTRFQDLGATLFHPPGWADDAVGLDLVVDEWIDNFWIAVQELILPGSSDKMSTDNKEGLTLPTCPQSSLSLEYLDGTVAPEVDLTSPNQPYPLIENTPVKGCIANAMFLTKPGAVKTCLEITIQFESEKFGFEPGDAISIVCPNPYLEVEALLQRLGVLDRADKPLSLKVKEGAKGKLPLYIPQICTPRQIFLYFCDIRTSPKKTFLRLLAESTCNEVEKAKLLELSSRQGAALFENTVRIPGLSLMDLLLEYPSCNPKMEDLVEHLPRLIPRAYSISSSPLASSDKFTFAFNVITFSEESGRKYNRLGVCTGWLYDLSKEFTKTESDLNCFEDLSKKLTKMSLLETLPVKRNELVIYKRKNHSFRLPKDKLAPVIMVGPGTGVAPFVGFVEHRKLESEKDNSSDSSNGSGELSLYFGCRHKKLDFLYEDKLKKFESEGALTKLYLSCSRDAEENDIKYVQTHLEKNKDSVVSTLFEKEGYLYVCGMANMAKNVKDAILNAVQEVKGIPEAEAKSFLSDLTSKKRYLQDVWC